MLTEISNALEEAEEKLGHLIDAAIEVGEEKTLAAVNNAMARIELAFFQLRSAQTMLTDVGRMSHEMSTEEGEAFDALLKAGEARDLAANPEIDWSTVVITPPEPGDGIVVHGFIE